MMKHAARMIPLVLALFCFSSLAAQDWPRRVLITNDNGIDDPKIAALAVAFSKTAQTFVVAPLQDRSGTGSFMSVSRSGQLRVEQRSLGEGITALAVDGYPADCVIFALSQLMADNPPDLVVSGINGGPNLGMEWFGSGTVGAARTAALGGLPALAVSGLDDDIPGAVEAATEWVVRFSSTPLVRSLQGGQYLTVSLPRLAPSEIKGIAVVRRSNLLPQIRFTQEGPSSGSPAGMWKIELGAPRGAVAAGSDIAAYQANKIAIVPMNVTEHDSGLMKVLQQRLSEIPAWTAEAQENR
ncbi:MAG: 5'/3'-nucleotidase SurE [Acidobacteriota bacterium]